MAAVIVLSTFPNAETARQIARTVVEEQFAACGNLIPEVESIYWWHGTIETSAEVLGMFKTTEESYSRLESRIKELHPYEVPEIIALPVAKGFPAYLQWIVDN